MKSSPRLFRQGLCLVQAWVTISLCLACAIGRAQGLVHEPLDLYLLMGQSNMAGRDTRDLQDQVDDARIRALDAHGQWVLARDPIHAKTGRIEPGVGPGIAFAHATLEAGSGRLIGLIPTAVGGTPLRRWERGGDLYEKAVAIARDASSRGVLRGVLWHQGEADAANAAQAASYADRLTRMFKDLRVDLGNPDLPIVVGQLGGFVSASRLPAVETVQIALRQMSSDVRCVGFADSAGLDHMGDALHFSAAASRELGRRYASAMQALLSSDGCRGTKT